MEIRSGEGEKGVYGSENRCNRYIGVYPVFGRQKKLCQCIFCRRSFDVRSEMRACQLRYHIHLVR